LSGLRRRSLSFLLLIASALLIAPPSSRAQSKPPINSQNCGASVEENLTAAQKALQSNDATARVALVCVIEAENDLDKRLKAVESRNASGALTAPVVATPCNWAGANGCR
jgi:hypothetical protein